MPTYRFSFVGSLPGHPDYGREVCVTKTAAKEEDARKLARKQLEIRGNWRCFVEASCKTIDSK